MNQCRQKNRLARTCAAVLLAMAFAFSLAGCGQKGGLTRPEATPSVQLT